MSAPPSVMLVYGLAFFVLGLAILIYPKYESRFDVADDLWLVAAFGLIHGVNEWVDMLLHVSDAVTETVVLQVLGSVILPVSYLLLVVFGVQVLEREFETRWVTAIPVVLVAAWVVAVVAGGGSPTTIDVWSRYLLGTSGPLLTAYAIYRQVPKFEQAEFGTVSGSVLLMAVGFGFYGLFTGLVVPAAEFPPASTVNYASFTDVVGVPVQVFRGGFAVVAAVGTLRTLTVFDEETRQTLRDREQRFRRITERSYDAIVTVDADRRITYASPAVERIHGVDTDDLLGANLLSVVEPDASDQVETLLETLEAGESVQGVEVSLGTADGGRVPVEVNATPIVEDDEIAGVQFVYRDISDRRQREQLRILNRILSHDIRNDMNVVLGWAEYLRDDVDDENVEHLDNVIERSKDVVRLTQTAGDFIDVVAGGEPTLHAIGLRDVIEDEADRCRRSFEGATVEVGSVPDVEVEATDALASVFRNLLTNAVVHNDRDEPTVEVDATVEGETVTVRVADDGPGIPDNLKDEVFDQGRQAGHGEGTGIGLFLVQTLVDLYGGTVRVEDNAPRGTVFEVDLRTT